jgi:hypothetical protein
MSVEPRVVRLLPNEQFLKSLVSQGGAEGLIQRHHFVATVNALTSNDRESGATR